MDSLESSTPQTEAPQSTPANPEATTGAEGVQAMIATPETIAQALTLQSQHQLEQARAAREAMQEENREKMAALKEGFKARADADPQTRDIRSNKYLKDPEEGLPKEQKKTQAEKHAHYAQYGRRRWNVAAREGVVYNPGEGGPLDPKNKREYYRALRAYRRAAKNTAIEARMRSATRGRSDRYGNSTGIDPASGESSRRTGDRKLKGMPRFERGSIRGAERAYKRLDRRAKRDEAFFEEGPRFRKWLWRLGDKINGTGDYANQGSDNNEGQEDENRRTFVKKSIKVVKDGLGKVKPLTKDARIRSKEALGNGVISSKVAYHGLASVIARAKMEHAGSVMERVEHQQALYTDGSDMPKSIQDAKAGEVRPRSPQEEITKSNIDRMSDKDKEKLKEWRELRREKAIGRIQEQYRKASNHDEQAAQARKARAKQWRAQREARQRRQSARNSS